MKRLPKNKKNPILSIITVCYNEPNILETCASIAGQTFQDFEWIVIDGGSDVPTIRRLERYRHRMDVFISEADGGVYHAMNKGIRSARGEYLNFMNGGDAFYAPDVLEKVFGGARPRADILYGDVCYIRDNQPHLFQFPDKIKVDWLSHHLINHQSSFIKKQLFDTYGPYDTTYAIAADCAKWLELIFKHKRSTKHVPVTVAKYYLTGISARMSPAHLSEKKRAWVAYYPKWPSSCGTVLK